MKATFVSQFAPDDPAQWSGTVHHMMGGIRAAGIEVSPIGPLPPPGASRPWYFARHALYKLTGQSYAKDREPHLLKHMARRVEGQLAGKPVDVVISPSSVPLAYVKSNRPLVLWTDATFASMVGFYWHNLSGRSLRQGLAMEKQALARVDLAIYASRWAADSAIAMGADACKVHVVEFGANLDEPPSREQATAMIERRLADLRQTPRRLRLLFAGVEWERKGGRHAAQVAGALRALGFDVELAILGCNPPQTDLEAARAAGVRVEIDGFLDKRSETGRRKLTGRFAAAHFFLLPARAEAYGIVLAEANAFAVPCLVRGIGGMATVVNDANGRAFDAIAEAGEWAAAIAEMTEAGRYAALAQSSRAEYDTRLNWPTAALRVRTLIEGILNHRD